VAVPPVGTSGETDDAGDSHRCDQAEARAT
jgi:hypothetical protein